MKPIVVVDWFRLLFGQWEKKRQIIFKSFTSVWLQLYSMSASFSCFSLVLILLLNKALLCKTQDTVPVCFLFRPTATMKANADHGDEITEDPMESWRTKSILNWNYQWVGLSLWTLDLIEKKNRCQVKEIGLRIYPSLWQTNQPVDCGYITEVNVRLSCHKNVVC